MAAHKRIYVCIIVFVFAMSFFSTAGDQAQWGQRFSRNMISDEKNLPESFDPVTGKNIRWFVEVGTETHGTPMVAGGKVFIGTNNNRPRDPRQKGDRGVLMCFDERDGRFLWQLVVPKITTSVYWDWTGAGICSPATIEDDRVYIVTSHAEVMCLDINGMVNGNDGPFKDEGRQMVPAGQEAIEAGKTDADIIWLFDLIKECNIRQHDSAHCSILLDGQFLYVNTSNGVDDTHRHIASPDAPCLIVIDKTTGRIVARDDEHIGPNVFHCTWSSPALAEVNGRKLIIYAAPNGIVYGFEPIRSIKNEIQKLQKVWWFDMDPTSAKEKVHRFTANRVESPSTIHAMPVFYKKRIYFAGGGDIWWGKRQSWLKCIDATQTGDVTKTAEIWSYPLTRHNLSSPAIYEGLIYVADSGRKIHCVDAENGKCCWVHDVEGEMWASTLAADGKVYIGTRRGEFVTLAAGREKRVLSTIELDSPISGTATAANGVLYVVTQRRLYAVKNMP